jgi:hypothetical protein
MTEPKNVTAPVGTGGKSLKEQNRWQLWLVVAFNCIFLYGVVQANAIKVDGVRAAFTDANNLLPVGFALVLTTVLNGLLSPEAKARLVFLRWHHALPGHRAFGVHAMSDPRIDQNALLKLHGSASFPTDPVDQNRAWYRIYRTVEKDPAVVHVHRDFLLLRDYTGLAALFVVFCGATAMYGINSIGVRLTYFLLLLLQFAVVRQSASNYGIRMVTTVLALRAAAKEDHPKKPRVPRHRSSSQSPGKGAASGTPDGPRDRV